MRQGKSHVVERNKGKDLKRIYEKEVDTIVRRAANHLLTETSKFYSRRRVLSSSSSEVEENTELRRERLRNLTAQRKLEMFKKKVQTDSDYSFESDGYEEQMKALETSSLKDRGSYLEDWEQENKDKGPDYTEMYLLETKTMSRDLDKKVKSQF